MTGVGVARGETELGDLAVELSSVNGKNLAVKTRLPTAAQGFEPEFERRVREKLGRGNVRVTLEVVAPAPSTESVVDVERAESAATQLQTLAEKLGLSDGPSLSDVLSVPGVLFSSHSTTRVSRELPERVGALFDAALAELIEHRRDEGRSTVKLIAELIGHLEVARDSAAARAPELVKAHRERLLERVNEFLAGQARVMEDQDVLREISLFADRVDVEEELQRLAVHLAQARTLLASGGEVGRKLEFLLQETLREINTLGSKSPDAKIAHTVVEMKATIDRAREQAANLE